MNRSPLYIIQLTLMGILSHGGDQASMARSKSCSKLCEILLINDHISQGRHHFLFAYLISGSQMTELRIRSQRLRYRQARGGRFESLPNTTA
jgi:hypothetical protein